MMDFPSSDPKSNHRFCCYFSHRRVKSRRETALLLLLSQVAAKLVKITRYARAELRKIVVMRSLLLCFLFVFPDAYVLPAPLRVGPENSKSALSEKTTKSPRKNAQAWTRMKVTVGIAGDKAGPEATHPIGASPAPISKEMTDR